MQPRFPPPFGVPPGQPGFFPPQFPPPAGMPMFPPNMPGMPPGSLPPRMLHGMPPPPMFNPMMMPPRPMFPPGTVLPPQFGGLPPALMIPPAASASVIVGAPVLNAPVPAALYPNPAAGSMAMFNAASSANKEANSTSNLLHKHIFTNAYAGLPVTLYIGKIPLDFEDAKLSRMLEACGKVTKYARPIDPTTQVPASIAFVIYAQAICGLRCLNILNQYEVGRENDVPQRLEVRTGTKETTIMLSVQLVEKEAELTLPEGASIDEIYNPIRETMTRILNPPVVTSSTAVVELTNKVPTTPSAVAALAAVKSVAAETAGLPTTQSTEPTAPGDLTTRTGDSGNANYYAFIDDEEHDELGEKQLMSEIERFRMRQTQRDKEMEEQKRIKMKQRIRELYEAKKNEKIAAPVDHQAAIIAANNAAAADALLQGYLVKEDTNSKKRGNEEDAAELEAKKRRRLQVLQMLSEDIAVDLEAIKTAPTPAAPSAPAVPAPLKLVGLAKGKPAAGVSMGSKPGTFAAGIDGDEEDKPKREIVLLDYTADELQELESAYLQYQEEDDEEVAENGAVYKKKKKSLADLLSSGEASALQARVLAQAQALSASLAQKVSSNIAAAANSNAANAGSGTADQKAELRQLLDKIPTERDELYAYKINWGALHRNNVIASTMHGWIVKKIVEYLGEEEESLTAFIVGKLNTGCRPSELVDELCMVLDEDAEQFVQKLWRMLIYYSLKNE